MQEPSSIGEEFLEDKSNNIQSANQPRVEKLAVKTDRKTASAGLGPIDAGLVDLASKGLGEGKDLKEPEIEYILPNICCRCAKKEPTEYRFGQFKGKKKTYLLSSKTFIYSIKQPLCASCHDELKKIDAKAAKYAVIGGVIGGIFAALAVGISTNWQSWLFIVLAGIGGAIFAGVIANTIGGGSASNLAQFDGRNYIFNNGEYQRQFEELNSHLKDMIL